MASNSSWKSSATASLRVGAYSTWAAAEAGRSWSFSDSSLPARPWALIFHRSRSSSVGGRISYPQVSFLCGDAERLPFPAGSFDAVVNIESSHSYPDIDAFYAEVSRVLKPGGVFLYSDTMPASEAASRLERLTGHGFRIELARDITSNVVRSCDELAGIHAQAFDAGNAPEVLGDFLAVPGSQNYDNLRSGRLVYGIWQLRKI